MRQHRNDIFHSSTLQVEDQVLDTYIKDCQKLLSHPPLDKNTEAKKQRQLLQEVGVVVVVCLDKAHHGGSFMLRKLAFTRWLKFISVH